MKKFTAKKMIIATIIMSTLTTVPALANEDTLVLTEQERHETKLNNENIGFGSGLVMGALVAGPIGAIVASVAGIFVAKHVNVNDDLENLTLTLDQEHLNSKQALARARCEYRKKLQAVIEEFEEDMFALEQEYNAASIHQAKNLLMSLQFSTGSSDIAPHYQEQVASLANILNNAPELKIDLSGYTDLTGESELNQTLSLARVNSVKQLLMAQGVNEEQIAIFAFGENAPVVASDDQEVSFYDRRVVLKLHSSLEQTVKN